MRFPVAAKMALVSARITAAARLPDPVGLLSVSLKWTIHLRRGLVRRTRR